MFGELRYFNSKEKIKRKTLRKNKTDCFGRKNRTSRNTFHYIVFVRWKKTVLWPNSVWFFFWWFVKEWTQWRWTLFFLFFLLDLCCFKTFFNDIRHIPEICDEKIKWKWWNKNRKLIVLTQRATGFMLPWFIGIRQWQNNCHYIFLFICIEPIV